MPEVAKKLIKSGNHRSGECRRTQLGQDSDNRCRLRHSVKYVILFVMFSFYLFNMNVNLQKLNSLTSGSFSQYTVEPSVSTPP